MHPGGRCSSLRKRSRLGRIAIDLSSTIDYICFMRSGEAASKGAAACMLHAEAHAVVLHSCAQIVMPEAQPWQTEHDMYIRAEDLRQGIAKEYPSQVRTLVAHSRDREEHLLG